MLFGLENRRLRSVLAQTTAVTIKNLLLLDLGVSSVFTILLIPALTGLSTGTNPNETIKITGVQASWLGSIMSVLTIVGSLLSGPITEPMGRKRAMLFVNIPHLVGWIVLYFATSLPVVFLGLSLLGLGVGLMEAPIITYVGEICEASVRDVMISTSGISATLGYLIVFFLGLYFDWRSVALMCTIIPIAALFFLSFVPETPIWLLSKHRDEEALRALQWLRGWVSEEEIKKEFNELKNYREYANACLECRLSKNQCTHPLPTLWQKFTALFQSSSMKPMLIITVCTFFTSVIGAHSLNPYLAQILNTFQTPLEPTKSSLLFGFTAFTGTITYMVAAKFTSKRSMYLFSIAGSAILNIWLGIHGLVYLPPNSKSFEHANSVNTGNQASYIPLILIVVLRFLTNGLLNVPIMYQSELFPLKSRCFATGVAQAIANTILFVVVKTFYDLENWLNMSIAFCIYGVIAVIGLYVCYKICPATENRTLEEIEKHFSDSTKKLTDWKIAPSTMSTKF